MLLYIFKRLNEHRSFRLDEVEPQANDILDKVWFYKDDWKIYVFPGILTVFVEYPFDGHDSFGGDVRALTRIDDQFYTIVLLPQLCKKWI